MKTIKSFLILLFSFCLISGAAAEDQRVRLTLPPEQAPDPAWASRAV